MEKQKVLVNVRRFQRVCDVNSRFHTSTLRIEERRGKSLQPLEKQDRDKRALEDERMTEERRWRGRERAREGGRVLGV